MREDGRVVVAQRRLGHAKASTTMDLYGHTLPGDPREAAAKVLAAIHRAKPAPNISRCEGLPKGSKLAHETLNSSRFFLGRSLKPLGLLHWQWWASRDSNPGLAD